MPQDKNQRICIRLYLSPETDSADAALYKLWRALPRYRREFVVKEMHRAIRRVLHKEHLTPIRRRKPTGVPLIQPKRTQEAPDSGVPIPVPEPVHNDGRRRRGRPKKVPPSDISHISLPSPRVVMPAAVQAVPSVPYKPVTADNPLKAPSTTQYVELGEEVEPVAEEEGGRRGIPDGLRMW